MCSVLSNIGEFLQISGVPSDFPGSSVVKLGFDPWVEKIPWNRKWQPAAVFLLGKFYGQRSLVGPWGRKESDVTGHTQGSLCLQLPSLVLCTVNFAAWFLGFSFITAPCLVGSALIYPVCAVAIHWG